MLILNGTHDRETVGMSASSFVASITDALNRKFCDALDRKHCDDPCPSLNHLVSSELRSLCFLQVLAEHLWSMEVTPLAKVATRSNDPAL